MSTRDIEQLLRERDTYKSQLDAALERNARLEQANAELHTKRSNVGTPWAKSITETRDTLLDLLDPAETVNRVLHHIIHKVRNPALESVSEAELDTARAEKENRRIRHALTQCKDELVKLHEENESLRDVDNSSTVAQLHAQLDDARSALATARESERLLVYLQLMADAESGGWVLRDSTTGRGMRLHQCRINGAYATPKLAIKAHMEANEEWQRNQF